MLCDLCGKQGVSDSWDSGYYELNECEIEVKVRQKDGYSSPDGGAGESYIVDMCPQCFKEKLVPWLREQGANIKPTDWDY